MYTKKSIIALESDLLQYEQAYAFGDIEKPEYEKAKADITAKIGYKKLVLAKQRAGRLAETLKANLMLNRVQFNRIMRVVYIAETENDALEIIKTLNDIQTYFQNKAA